MLKQVKHVLSGSSQTVDCMINTDAVLWFEASHAGNIGNTHVALLGEKAKIEGAGFISLDIPPAKMEELLAKKVVALTRDDRMGRPDFQNTVYVVLDRIRLIVPINNFFHIQFLDGSELGVKDIKNISGNS